MVGSWVKIRQTNVGVWKDAELTRYYPNRGEYDLTYVDGSTYAQGQLHACSTLQNRCVVQLFSGHRLN